MTYADTPQAFILRFAAEGTDKQLGAYSPVRTPTLKITPGDKIFMTYEVSVSGDKRRSGARVRQSRTIIWWHEGTQYFACRLDGVKCSHFGSGTPCGGLLVASDNKHSYNTPHICTAHAAEERKEAEDVLPTD